MAKILNIIKTNLLMTFKLLWQFKWYICPYLLFYSILIVFYLTPSCKQYFFWNNEEWYQYTVPLYLAGMRLVLTIFLLLFFLGLSNIKNHPILAKMIFLSSNSDFLDCCFAREFAKDSGFTPKFAKTRANSEFSSSKIDCIICSVPRIS